MRKFGFFLATILLFTACSKKSTSRDSGVVSASQVAKKPTDTAAITSPLPPPVSTPDTAPVFSDMETQTETDPNAAIHVAITDAIVANTTGTGTDTSASPDCTKLGAFWVLDPISKQCKNQILQTGHSYFLMSGSTGSCISDVSADAQGHMVAQLSPCKNAKDQDNQNWIFTLESDNTLTIHPKEKPTTCMGALGNQKTVPTALSTNATCGWASHFTLQASSTADPNQNIVPISLTTDSGLCLLHPLTDTTPTLTPTACGEFPWLLLDTGLDPNTYFSYLGSNYATKTHTTDKVRPGLLAAWMQLLPIDCGSDSIESIKFFYTYYEGNPLTVQATYVCSSTSSNLATCVDTPSDCIPYPTGSTTYNSASLFYDASASTQTGVHFACGDSSRLSAMRYQTCTNSTNATGMQAVTHCCGQIGDQNKADTKTSRPLDISTNYYVYTGNRYLCVTSDCQYTTACFAGVCGGDGAYSVSTGFIDVTSQMLTSDFPSGNDKSATQLACQPGEYLKAFWITQKSILDTKSGTKPAFTVHYDCGHL